MGVCGTLWHSFGHKIATNFMADLPQTKRLVFSHNITNRRRVLGAFPNPHRIFNPAARKNSNEVKYF